MIWKHEMNLELLNSFQKNTLVDHLGIEVIGFGDDFLEATMPVDHRTKQPMGLLHGGASVALAETLGSIASTFLIEDHAKQQAVGLEINANHLKSAKSGLVTGVVTPIRVGRSVHVWEINITNDKDELVCRSRLTVMVIDRR